MRNSLVKYECVGQFENLIICKAYIVERLSFYIISFVVCPNDIVPTLPANGAEMPIITYVNVGPTGVHTALVSQSVSLSVSQSVSQSVSHITSGRNSYCHVPNGQMAVSLIHIGLHNLRHVHLHERSVDWARQQ